MKNSDFSLWSSWSECTISNGEFVRSRSRICTDTDAECSNHPLLDEEKCIFNVWHGESDIADFSVVDPPCADCEATSDQWASSMMFDVETGVPPTSYGAGDDQRTLWISQSCNDPAKCVVDINFHSAIDFQYLTIVMRHRLRNGVTTPILKYKYYCLTLDDNDEVCTTSEYGFDEKSKSPPYEIDFVLPKRQVKNVKLSHKQSIHDIGGYHLLIADLKIHYQNVNTKMWHGDLSIASIDNKAGTYIPKTPTDCVTGNCDLENIFDGDDTTYWHSDPALGRVSN